MRGNVSLFSARKRGDVIKDVWIFCFKKKQSYSYTTDPEKFLDHGYLPEIHIFPSDNLLILDLRCIYGINVHVDESFTAEDLKAIRRFKPRAIYLTSGEKYD